MMLQICVDTKSLFIKAVPQSYRNETAHMLTGMLAGACAGITGAAVGSPFFLIKTRMQSYSPHLAVGTQHKYSSAFDALRSVYRTDGLRGIYSGAPAAMMRYFDLDDSRLIL